MMSVLTLTSRLSCLAGQIVTSCHLLVGTLAPEPLKGDLVGRQGNACRCVQGVRVCRYVCFCSIFLTSDQRFALIVC